MIMKKQLLFILLLASAIVARAQQHNTKIIITGVMVNPRGTDAAIPGTTSGLSSANPHKGGFEYMQFLAVKDIDFSVTPYTVLVCNNPGATPPTQGWATAGAKTYKFNLTSGTAAKGTYFYVGGPEKCIGGYWNNTRTTDISETATIEANRANWIRTIAYSNTAGDVNTIGENDIVGNARDGLFSNSGNPSGIAVFEGITINDASVPVDAVFWGTATNMTGSAIASTYQAAVVAPPAPALGYRVPNSDIFDQSKGEFLGTGNANQANRLIFVREDVAPYSRATDRSNFLQLGGIYDDINNKWINSRLNNYNYITLADDTSTQTTFNLSDIENGGTKLQSTLSTNNIAQILAWDFYANKPKEASYTSTYNNPDIEVSQLTRGEGASSTTSNFSNGVAISFTGTATNYETAKTSNSYMEFKVLSKTHYTSLSDLDIKLRVQNASSPANKYRWTYRKKGQTEYTPLGTSESNIAYDTANDLGITQPTLDLSTVTDLQNIAAGDTVTFRLYAWGGTGAATNATTGIGKSTPNEATSPSLILRGITTSVPINSSTEQQIAGWQFSTTGTIDVENPTPITSPVNATSSNEKLSTHTLSRGTGLAGATYQRAFVSTLGTSSANLSDAEAANEYYQIDLNAATDYSTSLSWLLYRIIRATDGPTSYQWKYSIDEGTTFTNIGPSGTFHNPSGTVIDAASNKEQDATGLDMYLNLQDITALRNVSSDNGIILRLYAWGNTSPDAYFGFGRFTHQTSAFNSIYIKGKIESTLPVQLNSFDAKYMNKEVRLNWSTASEKNNLRFDILKSTDGITFNKIDEIAGHGTTQTPQQYSTVDNNPAKGINYYQLRQVDTDGKTSLSKVIAVKTDLAAATFAVNYTNNNITILFENAGKETPANINLTDITGRSILAFKQNITTGINNISFNVPYLASGIYVVSLVSENSKHAAKIQVR